MRWAALVPKEQRPVILNEKHRDWPKLLRWVPRSWTSWLGWPPQKIMGSAEEFQFVYPQWGPCWHPRPIPAKGWWIGIPYYLAIRKGRWYMRAGFRWDDIDCYYALSFTVKRYPKTP